MDTEIHSLIWRFIDSAIDVDWNGFPFILLGILRMKRKKKKEKKGKEGGLVSSWRPLNSLPQVVVAFAKKNLPRAKARGNRKFEGTTWDFVCTC
jgi:hypothetical protein